MRHMSQSQGCPLLVLATAFVACSSSKDRTAQQLESCTIVGGVATSAPSGDAVTQCLIMKYDWRGRDALSAGQVYQAHLDSIMRALRDADSVRRAEADQAALA